jgi:uncharacterized membrane protein
MLAAARRPAFFVDTDDDKMLDWLLVLIHVPAGIVAVAGGAAALWPRKGGRLHRRGGRIYLAAVACASGVGLALVRPPHFPHLLVLAAIAAGLAAAGYAARRRAPAFHLLAMGASYTAMLTAFYVDNGPKLPVWRLLPPAAFWLLPAAVAAPLLWRAARRQAAEGRP